MQKNSSTQTDVAIVGGGMVGLTLALLLARHNAAWRITLLDSFPLPDIDAPQYHPSFDARSTAIAVGSREILQAAGVWDTLKQHLTCINTVHVSDRGHFGGVTLSAQEHGQSALGYVIENAWLGNVLAAEIKKYSTIDCRMPAVVTRLRAQKSGYEIQIQHDKQENNSEILQSSLVILADGADSQLRAQLGIASEIKKYDQSAIIANVQFDRPHLGIAYERFTEHGPLALLPLGESSDSRSAALVWTQPTSTVESLLAQSDEEFLLQLQRQFGFRLGNFVRVGKRNAYPLQLQVAKEQVRRNLVVMGNAAHFLHPVAGQGFNLALRDCAALVDVLSMTQQSHHDELGFELGDVALLQRYIERQQFDQWATIQWSDGLVKLFSTNHFFPSVLRNLGLFAFDALPPAKQTFARQAMGFALG